MHRCRACQDRSAARAPRRGIGEAHACLSGQAGSPPERLLHAASDTACDRAGPTVTHGQTIKDFKSGGSTTLSLEAVTADVQELLGQTAAAGAEHPLACRVTHGRLRAQRPCPCALGPGHSPSNPSRRPACPSRPLSRPLTPLECYFQPGKHPGRLSPLL